MIFNKKSILTYLNLNFIEAEIMSKKNKIISLFTIAFILLLSACQVKSVPDPDLPSGIKVIAVESFLADIAQNVAGDRLRIETLMPEGLDPHSFEPTPRDVAKINDSDVLIINGAGFEAWLVNIAENLPPDQIVVEASAGLQSRTIEEDHSEDDGHEHEIDPHFWLDPNLVITYVENIRDGLAAVDPQGKAEYAANAEAYIQQLKDLDLYIQDKVREIPVEQRLIVTNHESFGYFADRYGFKVVGTIIHSVSSGSTPSAQQMAALVDKMRASGAKAIFMETGSNTQLADQLSKETGIKVVYDLYTHSISAADGNAPSYIDLMKYNVDQIVTALRD